MKSFILTAMTALGCVALPLTAQAEDSNLKSFFSSSSGSVGVYSDYVFRGISQSDEKPAVQGTVNFGAATGPYLGFWGSNVDYNDGDEAQLEIDGYGGYKWLIGKVTLDAGAIYYAYPGADENLDYDYIEAKLVASGQWDKTTLGLSVFVSPDYFAGSGLSVYTNANASHPLGNSGFSLNAAVGYMAINDEAAYGVPDYADWALGVSYALDKFTLGLNYYDTNLSKGECADGCEARVVASVSRGF